MKLYSKDKESELNIAIENNNILIKKSKDIDKDITLLDNYIKAYKSLVKVEKQISNESYNFIDKNNYILYNEYITTITSNLDIKYIPILSQETVNTLPTTALNHHIALEGFISDIWKKIKEIFIKIYTSIKEFFNKYFTRLGRIKNKLNNLTEVINEIDSNLSKDQLDNVPNGLASKFPFGDSIDSSAIIEVINNINTLVNSLNEINKKANDFTSKDILDKDFIAEINRLKQDIDSTNQQIASNEKDKVKTNIGDRLLNTSEYQHNENIKEKNKKLTDEVKEKTKLLDSDIKKVEDIVDKELDLDNLDNNKTKEEFNDFIETLVNILNKVKGKRLVNGKNIINVSGSSEDGLKIETDENKDTPSTIRLGTKGVLRDMVKNTLAMIEQAEKLINNYAKINDIVMDNINKVDKLILDLDKSSNTVLNKYKRLLNNKIKTKLNLVKTFFNNYNKVSKNIFEMALDTAEGVCDYATLSLKYFGKEN